MAMEDILAAAEKEVLVDLVKVIQKRRLEGSHGGWKDFLNHYDRQIGSSLSDPSRRSRDVLVAFLTTFHKKEDKQLFATILKPNRYLALEYPDDTIEQRLVRMTITHDEYALDYCFASSAEDWLVIGTGKKNSESEKASTEINMVAIDCEMVQCDDGKDAVVRVAAVDRDLKVILDEFVKPHKPVVDYRTDVTGLTAEDLENANTLSLVEIQDKLQMLVSEDTILVGQSLENDMNVLKIDHARVIDTALVFEYKYPGFKKPRKFRRPSLNYLCKTILGYEVQTDGVPHNCVDDAVAAMKLVLAIIEKGVETSVPLTNKIMEDEMSRLLLHRIPQNVPSEELNEVISRNFTHEFKLWKRQRGCYDSATIVFNSPAEANQAFENIGGELGKDSAGLPQKQVFLKPSSGSEPVSYFYVRKMVDDDSVKEISVTKRSQSDDKKMSCKKQKRENDSEETREASFEHCGDKRTEEKTEKLREDDLLKEIEELKLKLKEKDQMIDFLEKQLRNKKKTSWLWH